MDFKAKKILIVEANRTNADTIASLYKEHAFTDVEMAETVSSCIDMLSKHSYSLLLVGQLDDNKSIVPFLQQLRETFSKNELAILYLVKPSNISIIKDIVNLGVHDYILKPISVNELLLRSEVLLCHENRDVEDAYKAFEQNKMAAVGEMISMIAHQWRQPLSSMGAAIARVEIDLLTESLDLDALTTTCNDMKSTIGYLSDTIDDFRYFFTPSKEKEVTTLQEIVNRTQSVISISLAHNRITLIVDEPLVDTPLSLYVSEVVQVLINILNNATDELIDRKVTRPCIWVSSAKIGNYVTLVIRDNAGGIKEDVIPKIFDPYFSTKKKKNGSGLGLYMAKNIIQRHCHGNIEVRNGDEGAEFMIKIPIETDSDE